MTESGAFLGVAPNPPAAACGGSGRDDRPSGSPSRSAWISPDTASASCWRRAARILDEGRCAYLEPRLRDQMPDPSQFRDMDQAAARLADAIQSGEQIAIFGDYDVDGATSSALLIALPAHAVGQGADPLRPRPHEGRLRPQRAGDAGLAASEGAELVITVDCGVTALAPLEAAKDAGLDVLVVDHHVAEPPCRWPPPWSTRTGSMKTGGYGAVGGGRCRLPAGGRCQPHAARPRRLYRGRARNPTSCNGWTSWPSARWPTWCR